MNVKKRIMAYLTDPPCDHGQDESCEVCDNVRRIMSGMSMGTATLVIGSAVRQKVTGDDQLEALENRGRYYTASIVNHDGSIFQELLVDKQTGEVRFV